MKLVCRMEIGQAEHLAYLLLKIPGVSLIRIEYAGDLLKRRNIA